MNKTSTEKDSRAYSGKTASKPGKGYEPKPSSKAYNAKPAGKADTKPAGKKGDYELPPIWKHLPADQDPKETLAELVMGLTSKARMSPLHAAYVMDNLLPQGMNHSAAYLAMAQGAYAEADAAPRGSYSEAFNRMLGSYFLEQSGYKMQMPEVTGKKPEEDYCRRRELREMFK